ncbi:hypothetical protein O181_061818 [Austropuccinia psidii MF-1]|uniref:Uncharacterized protein n=1 Tax=Austropuccinia psidii MF-1 TaxID=1389203 RepID=A0A9Q3ENL4_9BASI|nr:hypothetical protein [Austropuccinia psidii MF-1]
MAHKLRNPLQPGDLALVYNKRLESNWELLLKNHWSGPFRVIIQVNKGLYKLEELDGTKLTRKFAASHIKRFYPRGKIVHLDSGSGNDSSEESEVEDSILEEEQIENYT